MLQGTKIRNLSAAIWRAILNINFFAYQGVSEHCYHIYQKLLNSTYAFKCYHQKCNLASLYLGHCV